MEGEPLRILVVEDVPEDAELVAAALRRAEIALEWRRVDDEPEFVEALGTYAPELILSDYAMPSFSGMEALALALERAPGVPFIIVTGSLNEETAVDCMRSGAWDYVLKGQLSRLPGAVIRAVELARSRAERARAQAALRDSEEIYRAIVSQAADGIVLIDAETLEFTEFNDAACRGLGYRREEFARLSLLDLQVGATEEDVKARMAEVVAAGGGEFENPQRRRDGTWREVHVSNRLVSVRGRDYLAGIWRDITERKLADRAMEEFVRGREFLARSAVGLVGALPPGGLFRFVAEQVRSLVPRALVVVSELEDEGTRVVVRAVAGPDEKVARGTEVLGRDPVGLVLNVVEPTWGTIVRGGLSRVEGGIAELAFGQLPPGVPETATVELNVGAVYAMPFTSGDEVLGTVAVLTDRSEGIRSADVIELLVNQSALALKRQRVEDALRESERRYRSFFEQDITGDFIAGVDGRIVDCNPAFVRMFGFDSVEHAKEIDVKVMYPQPEGRRAFLEKLRERRELTNHEQELRRLDGTPVHVVENAVGLFDESGDLIAVKGYLFDITPHKRIEEQLRQAQKMEAVGRLAGGIAHDFNNLLQAILANVQLLGLETGGEGPLGEAVRDLAENVRRGSSLTRQLLLFARRGIPRYDSVDLNGVVQGSELLLRRLLRENIQLLVRPAAVPLPVEVDRGQIEQVIVNLAVNAADAMPEGGRLDLVVCEGPAGEACLEVTDTGVGIPGTMLEQIFEPFFTTKSAERGTGLGLAVVHGIVTQHGGRVEVTSTVGAGSTFRVLLPRSAKKSTESAAGPEAGSVPRGRGQRLLVVEDNDTVRTWLARALVHLGYEVTAVGSGEEAGGLPSEPGFDLLLTDVMLPGSPGPRVAEELRARWPELAVILISGYAEDEVLREQAINGSVRFLQKPVDLAALAREVSAALQPDS